MRSEVSAARIDLELAHQPHTGCTPGSYERPFRHFWPPALVSQIAEGVPAIVDGPAGLVIVPLRPMPERPTGTDEPLNSRHPPYLVMLTLNPTCNWLSLLSIDDSTSGNQDLKAEADAE